MKRIFSLILSLTLLFALSIPAMAATDDSGASKPLSLDDVEKQWLEHSTEYVKINYDLSLAEENYNDLKKSTDLLGDHLASATFPTYQTLMSNKEKAKCAFDIAKVQYDANVQNGILSAKKAFIACWQDDLNLTLAKQNLDTKQSQLTNYATALQNGYISQTTYDNLKSSVDGLKNNISSLESKKSSDMSTLKLKLGIDFDSDLLLQYPEFGKDYFDSLMVLDFDSDLAYMKANNVNLKVLQITSDSMQSGSYANYNQKRQAQLNLKNAATSLEPNFTLMYQNLSNQYQDLQTSYANFELEKDKLTRTQQQYSQGYVSSLTLSNVNLEYSNMQTALYGKEATLYLSYLSYKNAAIGY